MRWLLGPLCGAFLLFGFSSAWAETPSCQTPKWVHDYMYDATNPPVAVTSKILTSDQLLNLLHNGPEGAPAYLSDPKTHVIAEAYGFPDGLVIVAFFVDGCMKNHLKTSVQKFVLWIAPAGTGA